MKRPSLAVAVAAVGVIAVGVGCQSEPPAVPSSGQPAANTQVESSATSAPIDSPAKAMTFVSLKVPNMV